MAGARAARRLSVEGNIAVGKSTFVRLLRRAFPSWQVVLEPVSKWQKLRAAGSRQQAAPSQSIGNLLQLLYQDPSRWSYTFQTYSCLSRLKAQLQPLSANPAKTLEAVQVFERSVYSDRFVFAKNLFEIGHLTEIEWTIYQHWHTFLLQAFGDQLGLHGFLYLRAPPEVCMERLCRRARPEEQELQLCYLEQLHTQHEDWLLRRSPMSRLDGLGDVPVLVLDVSRDFEHDPSEQGKLVSQVRTFVESGPLAALPSAAAS
ncbi:deoxyguanosine kinase, mitochondrial isoform X1 [Varanus komodoensis]|uniref:deoxyguanosine kinase, mitochondrial isoform X1 n=1 Tax=Varanus komodoensis TaxID=61221 RepID=UPI001CF7AC99|nr:deoxyguanosine kinase, mitochondrial isoform X1 [Varanus komodoensis]